MTGPSSEGRNSYTGVVELQFLIQRLRKVRAHPLIGLSELHHVSSKRYDLH